MNPLLDSAGHTDSPRWIAAELALFALWCGCTPAAPSAFTPTFSLGGLVTSATAVSLHDAAIELARTDGHCWLVAGHDDLSAPGAILQVTVSREAVDGLPAPSDVESHRAFRFPAHLVPSQIASDAATLVFGGHTRLRATGADMTAAQLRFGLFGPYPSCCADLADSPWAVGLLPHADRSGYKWAIMLGRSVAYDPPWNRDAV